MFYCVNKIEPTITDCTALNESFDFKMNRNSNESMYLKELHKFNAFYQKFYFNSGKLLTTIDSKDFVLNEKEINHIIKLYIYYKKYNKNNTYLLAEFLLSYYNTIKNNGNAKEILKKSLSNFPKLKKPIYEFTIVSNRLYNIIVDYAFKNTNFYFYSIIDRIFFNLKNTDLRSQLIDKLLINEYHPEIIIKYDNDIPKNKKIYENYVKKIIKENSYYVFPLETIFILNKKHALSVQLLEFIINSIVEKTNLIQNEAINTSESIIQIITEIDECKTISNKMINGIKTLNEKQLAKIHECIEHILYVKRILLSNNKILEDSTKKISYKPKISNEKIEKVATIINDDIYHIYKYVSINFIDDLKEAIKSYSKYPLTYMITNYTINTNLQTYQKENNTQNSIFKIYYDKIGKDYTEKKTNLINKLENNFYELLLKYLQSVFINRQSMLIKYFDLYYGRQTLLKKLISLGHYESQNKYVVLAKNVIQAEVTIIEIMKSKKLNYCKDGALNLRELASKYISKDNYFNGFMYINYVFYEESGLNIRNNIAHGNYFNENIDIELLASFGVISFVNAIYYEECKENGKDK